MERSTYEGISTRNHVLNVLKQNSMFTVNHQVKPTTNYTSGTLDIPLGGCIYPKEKGDVTYLYPMGSMYGNYVIITD